MIQEVAGWGTTQYYFDTLFPRIPEVARREIVARLEDMGLPTKSGGATGAGAPKGDSGNKRPPSVKAALSVNLGQRAPHRADVREQVCASLRVKNCAFDLMNELLILRKLCWCLCECLCQVSI